MKKLLFFGILVSSIGISCYSYSVYSLSANNLLLSNIEALASGEPGEPGGSIVPPETPTEITTCFKDKDITSDKSKPTSYTICNSGTTSTLIYFCGNQKKGYQLGWYDYKCKVKK